MTARHALLESERSNAAIGWAIVLGLVAATAVTVSGAFRPPTPKKWGESSYAECEY